MSLLQHPQTQQHLSLTDLSRCPLGSQLQLQPLQGGGNSESCRLMGVLCSDPYESYVVLAHPDGHRQRHPADVLSLVSIVGSRATHFLALPA